ncbi:uncharacterized protein CTHT_0008050 [Thermochaetoides thermophila DSM 1495]|uniref:Uncharacterized protein n=1 Tax=Chaetomium thermophilum (strain DSM 1495 / CBS 144.50 / IMI 039719) TaxID=759272 RepID=G0RZY3_CHATD|nr:hypothetical protein CTHT_0008050 [Thermochaetoides thermophila DSM 1495]EGS23144.1 hypothetical protein CTHT_0008050 [Thermochaetoides thermophila DSM 1495]
MDFKQPRPSGNGQDGGKKRKEPPTAAKDNRSQSRGTPTNAPSSSRAAKRVKWQDARNIRTLPADDALDDGKLDLQKFIEARTFEIQALESSMAKCKAASATRVFQQVPRSMRRRTASHNAKRVPKRLRERAKKEMLEDNTPTVEARKRRPRTTRARIRAETAKRLSILAAKKKKKLLQKKKQLEEQRAEKGDAQGPSASGASSQIDSKPKAHTRQPRPKIRRNMLNDPPKADSKFRKRQINKTWLPTHLWHAKRAKMTEPKKPLWRFAIPLTPTEKCYRPTHRALGQKGAVAWDMSYMSTISLSGTANGVERVLKELGLTQETLWGIRGQKWRAGLRTWTGILSRQTKGSRRDIGPATIIWNPEDRIPADDQSSRPKKSRRQLLIRTHPSCFLELFEELVKLAKAQSPQLHVEDLRFEIGSIELIGPGSTEALLGVLKPYHDKTGSEERHAQVFKSLAGLTNPAALPKGALLSFSARDPRLSYPPKTIDVPLGGVDAILVELLAQWPADQDPKSIGLFDRDSRFEASRLPSQKAINRRKGANAPGEPLPVTDADPPIPIVLYASRPATDGQAQGTWTLMAPWKCIMPIWYALMHYPLSTGGNPRFGGLREQMQMAFEQGVPWFPADFPATDAGLSWELEQRAKRKQEWERRPKGKRVEWKSLDLGAGRKGEIGNGHACDFEHLFALNAAPTSSSSSSEETNTSSASGPIEKMDLDPPERAEGAETAACSKASTILPLGLVRQMTKASFTTLSKSPNPDKPPAYSIITVSITFVTRGVASTCARIYRLPTRKTPTAQCADVEVTATPANSPGSLPFDLRDQWLRKLPASNSPSFGNSKTGKGKSPSRLVGPLLPPAKQMPAGVDFETRKKLLAQSLIVGPDNPPLPYPKPGGPLNDPSHQNQHHPLCPGEEDLIGFVTTGAFSLSEGKGTAIGSISAEKALEALRDGGPAEGRLCVVRNAGESVGWLAKWELV